MLTKAHKHFALKRIQRDMQEFAKSKLVGISACIPKSSKPHFIIANIIIQEGIYNSLLVPISITLPEDYPISAPSVHII